MPPDTVIYQRTHAGREEIRNKSNGLTQSERLVLIMIDGVTPYRDLKVKLPVLSSERFDRALAKLEKSELILEVLLPAAGQPCDEIEKSLIDRYLQQDPLDPLTILALHPEEEDEDEWKLAPRGLKAVTVAPAMDETHIQLAETVSEEVKALQEIRTPRLEPIEFAAKTMFAQERAREERMKRGGWRNYLPYALLLTGGAFIAGFALARLIA